MDWDLLNTPLIFAHRGASADAPENTLSAFGLAQAQNADGIELDAGQWRFLRQNHKTKP